MFKFLTGGLLALSIIAGSLSLTTTYPALASEAQAQGIQPKPLNDSVYKGLAYLVSKQDPSGGWTEGEESQYMHASGKRNMEVPNVADTCMAVLALNRAGNLPNSGKYASNVASAIGFVCSSVERADETSLSVTDVKGTRVQAKLGPFVDTFLASIALAEAKDHMPDARANARVGAALSKVIAKIEKNQTGNGTWSGGGWAPVHSQALAAKGLNRAKQVGALVRSDVLARAEDYSKKSYNSARRDFSMDGAASVPLYAAGASLGSLQDSINTGRLEKPKLQSTIASKSASVGDKKNAENELKRIAEAEQSQKVAMDAAIGRLEDKSFVSGFGCNGGEEFLSYLQISETLLANNSPKWASWDKSISTNLTRVQGTDGSWMGQHCITSRTFCTAAGLLVLTADRAPQLAKIERGKQTASK